MEKIQLRLVLVGLAIILAGFLYGMIHTLSVEHEPRLSLKDDYKETFAQIADKGLESPVPESTFNYIEQVNKQSIAYQRAIGAHAHAIYLGVLIIVFALLLNIALSEFRYKTQVAIALPVGIVTYPLGLALQACGMILAGEALALIGSVTVITCTALMLFTMLRLPASKN